MTAEDAREQRRQEATQHALLVEGVAMAARAQWETVKRYAADWRKADWLDADAAPKVPPEPPFNLLTDPYFAGAALAAAQPPAPTASAGPDTAKPVPVYRVRKAADAR